jgi:hypothetical protein
MDLYRAGFTPPGVRDNDWAHTPYDDMRFAAGRGYLARSTAQSAAAAPADRSTSAHETPLDAPHELVARTDASEGIR